MALEMGAVRHKSFLPKEIRVEDPPKKCQKVPKSAIFRERESAQRAHCELALGQIKSNLRRGVCERLQAEHMPEIKNRCPDGRKPWAKLSESRSLSTSSF
jgi:hypothetical protein